MAVQEAIILAENNIPSDTFRKLQAMQEAEMNKLANAITEIIKRVKEFVTKFINDLQDKHGPNAAFMKRHAELIKKPFKINEGTEQEAIRNKWVIDTEIPIFTQDKDYVNKLIFI